MTDWRQIQARIRKAKHAPDAHAKLSELFQRTHDAMVAWELGAIEEKAERPAEAVRWYAIAAQRFRRAEWKKKAEEALARLESSVPQAELVIEQPLDQTVEVVTDSTRATISFTDETPIPSDVAETEEYSDATPSSAPIRFPAPDVVSESQPSTTTDGGADGAKKKRRRGRRGGRGRRRRSGAPVVHEPVEQVSVEPASAPPTASELGGEQHTPEPGFAGTQAPIAPVLKPVPLRHGEPPSPLLPSERSTYGRAELGLASRMAHLESLLRRLLTSPLHRLDETDEAPAGPGVFLLSESDQTASYYVEACQTLRVGLGNLLRSGRSGKGSHGGRARTSPALKAKLAEHLGIDEGRVSRYLKDHCAVRWIQLDDESQHLAHFAIGVLRTPLNLG